MTAATFSRSALAALLLAGTAMPARGRDIAAGARRSYRDNPTLTAARAGQRATDETVNIQKSASRPSASVSGSYSENSYSRPISPFLADRNLQASLSASVPIYQGGAHQEWHRRRQEARRGGRVRSARH